MGISYKMLFFGHPNRCTGRNWDGSVSGTAKRLPDGAVIYSIQQIFNHPIQKLGNSV
jgi:hypothetical protein